MRLSGFAVMAILWMGLASVAAAAPFPAFPGAEGWGAYTPGGRGGKVYCVTTLEDYRPGKEPVIPGSLREAVEAKGPRIVVFRVSGNIALKDELEIEEPYITIAGQTAPGGGICLKDNQLSIDTHDVVVRYLRVRPGDTLKREVDGLSCKGQNVIIDHCSVSWGIDETLSVTSTAANVTVQWCFITESLNDSYHKKGRHGYGSLINGEGPVTYHHNLYAFHSSRNPRPGDVYLDFRNNVIYGWLDRAGYNGTNIGGINYVGNYLKPAEYSRNRNWAFVPGDVGTKLYLEGNVHEGAPEGAADNWKLIKPLDGRTAEETKALLQADAPFQWATVTTDTAQGAWERVLAEGGASLPARDAADARVAEAVRTGGGAIVNSQDEVGGWPELRTTNEAPADGDSDGMSDDWETTHGLNPDDASDSAGDIDNDGFTNVEEYINGTDPTEPFVWVAPPALTPEGGPFVERVTVSLAPAQAGDEIRYTLDGSDPTRSSSLYAEPIVLTDTTSLRAVAFRDGAPGHAGTGLYRRLEWKAPAAVQIGTQPGLRVAYYEQPEWKDFPNFDRLQVVDSGVASAFDVSHAQGRGGCGFTFTGYLDVPKDGIYTFYGRSSERSQIQVGDEVVVDTRGESVVRSGAAALRAGRHPFEVRTYFQGEKAILEVQWSGPEIERGPIPAARLSCPAE